jgi:hypothetical protein
MLHAAIIVNNFRWFCNTSKGWKRVLSEEVQKAFLAKEFVSFEFKDLSPEQEEDLFARVQMGVQLSLAEKMRASTGPWQELAKLFVEDFNPVYSLMKDRARAKDFQLTVSCFSQIVEVMQPTAADGIPMLKTKYNTLPKLLGNKSAVDDGLKSHLASVWNTFKDLIELDPDTFTNANKYLRRVQTFAPIEMVGVAVMISLYSETRNKQLLLGDIRALREAIRESFADIRMNNPVWKFIWDFIDSLEAIRGSTDNSTVNRAEQRPPTHSTKAATPLTPTSPPEMKGRPKATPKVRTPKLLPPQQPVIVREQANSTRHSIEPRQPKRQRTDPAPQNLPDATAGYTSSVFGAARISPYPITSSETPARFYHPPTLTQGATSHATRVPNQGSSSSEVSPRIAAALTPTMRTPPTNDHHLPSASAFTISHGRPYVSAHPKGYPHLPLGPGTSSAPNLDGYRAPAAHMASSVYVPSKRPAVSAQTSPAYPPFSTSSAFVPVNSRNQSTPLFSAGAGISAPPPMEQRGAYSMTPQHRTPPEATASKPPSVQNARNTPPGLHLHITMAPSTSPVTRSKSARASYQHSKRML